MPANWPEITLALAFVALVAYAVADLAARAVQSLIGSIVGDEADRHVDRTRTVVRVAVFFVTLAALAVPALRFAGYDTAVALDPDVFLRWLYSRGLRIAVIATVAYLITRMGVAAAQRFEHEVSTSAGPGVIERTKRARTIGQLLQKALTTLVTVVALLMALRELQIDVTPLLAGAGIAGLAVGFGAQTLIRDIITGFFLIVEDQVRVGDVAVVNGQGGLVEQINLRTIVLRDLEGAVHVFPNGEIKTLANRTKEFAYYVIDLGMAYDEDPDRVADAVRDAAEPLMTDPAFAPHILEPVEILGVNDFADTRLMLRLRIKTVPQQQWTVGRELRKRIANTLRERHIEIPFAQPTIRVRAVERERSSSNPDQEPRTPDSGR